MTRALRTVGIRQILALSPEARGRSERAFGTIQGRLPQELKLAGITDYEAANRSPVGWPAAPQKPPECLRHPNQARA